MAQCGELPIVRQTTERINETHVFYLATRNTLLRKIYGPVQEGDTWRIRYNEEVNRFIKGKDIVKFIKEQRIRWLGHVKRMEAGAMRRRMMEGRLFIGRRKGRPRLRWMDDVMADLKVMKIRQWTEKAGDRE